MPLSDITLTYILKNYQLLESDHVTPIAGVLYLRKIDISFTIVGRLPYQDGLDFVLVVAVRNSRALGYRLCVIRLLPLANPLISLSIAGLQEKSPEHISARDYN